MVNNFKYLSTLINRWKWQKKNIWIKKNCRRRMQNTNVLWNWRHFEGRKYCKDHKNTKISLVRSYEKMEKSKEVKKITLWKPDADRGRLEDIDEIEDTAWREKIQDRDVWRIITTKNWRTRTNSPQETIF